MAEITVSGVRVEVGGLEVVSCSSDGGDPASGGLGRDILNGEY